jgi:hypothetical protein
MNQRDLSIVEPIAQSCCDRLSASGEMPNCVRGDP